MFSKAFKVRIIIVFIIPVLALLLLGYYFIEQKQKELRNVSAHILATEIVDMVSYVLHNIQLERDYSIVYLLDNSCQSCKDRLKTLYPQTDDAIKKYKHYIYMDSNTKRDIQRLLYSKNRPRAIEILKKSQKLDQLRASVQNGSVTNEEVLAFYNKMSHCLLEQLFSFTTLSYNAHPGLSNVYQVQQIKENESREGIYIYQYLLDTSHRKKIKKDLDKLEAREEKYKDEFMANYPKKDEIYYIVMELFHDEKIDRFKEKLFTQQLNSTAVPEWLELNHSRLSRFEEVSTRILSAYRSFIKGIYKKENNTLEMTYMAIIV